MTRREPLGFFYISRVLKYFFLISPLFFIEVVSAQNIVVNPVTDLPAQVVGCGDNTTFKFRLYGPTSVNEQVSVQLPVHAEFVALSAPGSGVSVNVSDLKNPIFTIASALANTSSFVDIVYTLRTGCTPMVDSKLVHELLSDSSINKTVDYPTVLYSVLEVDNTILPASATLSVNNTQNFTFTIGNEPVNTTAYSNNVVAYIEHSTNIEITYGGTGVFVAGTPSGGNVTDTITLGAVEIAVVGDNDNHFEKNESIDITVTAKLLGCPSGAGETISYQAAYGGCLSAALPCKTGNTSTSGIALSSGTAALYTRVQKHAWPSPSTTDTAEFLLRNDGSGSGHIYNLTLDLGFSNGGATYVPNDYIQYTWSNFSVNGNVVANSGSQGSFTDFQFASDPDGVGVGLEDLDGDGFFDDLPVGNSFVLSNVLAYNYLADTNGGVACDDMYAGYAIVRWAYSYRDQCGDTTSFNVPNNGLNTWRPWSFYGTNFIGTNINSSSGSSNFGPGDTFDFFIAMNSSQTPSQLNITGLHWEVYYTLPSGVIPNGNGTWGSQPFNLLSFDPVTRIAVYSSQSAPTQGYHLRYDPKIPLRIDPACVGSYAGSIHYEYHLKGDPVYEPINVCGDGATFTVTCPSAGPSVCVSDFSFDRTTLGYTDMSETTSINTTDPGIRLDHALEGDMVRWHVEVDINEANLQSAIALLEYDTNNWFSSQSDGGIKAINIEYIPAGGGGSTTFNDLGQYSYIQNNGGKTNHEVDLLGGVLIGIAPGIGDRYIIDVDLKVSETCTFTDWRYQPIMGMLVSSPVTSLLNPSVHSCNFLTDEFGMLYYYKNPYSQPVQQSFTVNGCDELNMGVRVGFSSYSKIGDLFPNEFRNFAIPKIVEILLPSGVDYVSGSSTYKGYPNEFTHVLPDPIITYDFEPGFHKYSWLNDGSWPKEKASNSYAIKDINFRVVPNCKIEEWAYSGNRLGMTILPTTTFETYRNIALPGRDINLPRRSLPRGTQYLPLDFTVSSPTPTITTETNSAAWTVNINNTSSGGKVLNNTWMAIEVPNNNIVPTLWNGATQIPLTGYGTGKYWAQIGNVDALGKQFEIKSNNFTVCGTDSFNVRIGQNCTQYPADPDTGYSLGGTSSNYNCSNEETIQLSLSTQNPSINVATALGSPPATYDFCSIVPYRIDVNNSANGFAYALASEIGLPVGMTLNTSSGVLVYGGVSYPVSNANISFDNLTNTYTVDISSISAAPISGANGLPGVSSNDPTAFFLTFDLGFTCDYISGSKLVNKIKAISACQEPINASQGQDEIKTNPVNVSQVPSNLVYAISVDANDNSIQACNQTETISVNITNQGIVTNGSYEFIVATIDDAFNYVTGSYNAGINGPASAPVVTVDPISGNRILKWPMPDGIPVASIIAFDFEIEVVSPSDVTCQAFDLNVATRIEQTIDCSSMGGVTCPSVESITSQTDASISVEKSTLVISSIATSSVISGNNQSITANFSVENISNVSVPSGTFISIYYDTNANGQYDGGDVLVGTKTVASIISALTTINNNITFVATAAQACNLLIVARLEDNPCVCARAEASMITPTIISDLGGADSQVCENGSIQLGTPINPNYTYSWSGSNPTETSYLNNVVSARPTFSYSGLKINTNTNVMYTVVVTLPNGCTMSDQVEVQIVPSPEATVSVTDTSCGLANGEITFNFTDYPNRAGLEFSLDNQTTYKPFVFDNLGSVTYNNLSTGIYHLWVRWGNNDCPVDLGNYSISTIVEVVINTHPPNQSIFVNDNASFSVSTENADTYQWQVSVNGGVVFTDISDGADYTGTQTMNLIVNLVGVEKNNFRYRALASNSTTSCVIHNSNSAILTVKVKTVITNRRITHRVNKD